MNLEKRWGSYASTMTLQLKTKDEVFVCNMSDDYKTFGSYDPKEGYVIHCVDEDPHSIVRQIENFEMVEKYVMSDEDYDKLPMNVRKFKKMLKKNNPELFVPKSLVGPNGIIVDPEHQKELSEKIQKGDRCEIKKDELRLVFAFLCWGVHFLGVFVYFLVMEPSVFEYMNHFDWFVYTTYFC